MSPPIKKVDYGTRPDGSAKGEGWFGPLKMTDGSGRVMTEYSIDVDGVSMPSITPNQPKETIDRLRGGGDLTDEDVGRAADWAFSRIRRGKSPFKD